jgi:hypothetical protein
MPFPDFMEALNSTVVSTFGNNESANAPQITYQPQSGKAYPLNGVIGDPAELDDEALALGNPAASAPYAARFSVVTSSFTQPPVRGDLVTVGTISYRVANIFSDAGGMTELYLRLNPSAP